MRRLIKKIFKNSQFIKTRYLNFLYNYDFKRFIEFSGTYSDDPEVISFKLRILIHTIEKALSLEKTKKNFGKAKILEIIRLYETLKSNPDNKDFQVIELAEDIISVYIDFCTNRGDDITFIPSKYHALKSKGITGTMYQNLTDSQNLNFKDFAFNRHSSRQFINNEISNEIIKKVLTLAQTAPSACNRQPIKVFSIKNKEKIDEVISIHGGINGFSKPSVIFAITFNLSSYQNENERTTGYVDSGIFTMNMLYALEFYNIAACPIIWSSEPDMNSKLRKIANITENYEISALIVAGKKPDKPYKVALSKRKPTNMIFDIIE